MSLSAAEISVRRLELMSERDALQAVVANMLSALGAFDAFGKVSPARGVATFLVGLLFRRREVRTSVGLAAALVSVLPVAAAYRGASRGARVLTSAEAFKLTLHLASACLATRVLYLGRRLDLLKELTRKKRAEAERVALV
jgi:hypothetical protein